MAWPLDLKIVLRNIRACEGMEFKTVDEGVPFRYEVEQDRIVIEGRSSAWVLFNDIRETLDRKQRPTSLHDLRFGLGREVWGSSYLYALLNDGRITRDAVKE